MAVLEMISTIFFNYLSRAFGSLLICYVLYLVGIIIYNLYFHPLRHYPGPLSWAATRIPFAQKYFSGTLYLGTHELHKKYGRVVRIGPDELSIIDPKAWKDIFTARTGTELMRKDARSLAAIKKPGAPENILTAVTDADHSRMKRVLTNAFSDRALKEQEDFVQRYVTLFIDSLLHVSKAGPVDINSWIEFVTFDIIGDLTFGKPLDILKNQHSDWLVVVNNIFRSGTRATTLGWFAHLRPLLRLLLRFSPSRHFMETHISTVDSMVLKRMAADTDRKDFAFYALQTQKAGDPRSSMSTGELSASFQVLMVAGSETSATTLSGSIFFLAQNKEVYKRLVTDIRTSFSKGSEITMLSVPSQKYLTAVLDETMRIMPPVAGGLPRIVPREGASIAGNFVPGGTRVTIPLWAAGRSSENFRDPESFIPERWLGDPRYENDRREVSNPFGMGPRGCIGKNLAYMEMRIILARLLFEFDIEMMEESRDWLDKSKNFSLWSKRPLMVKLTPVVRL